MLLLSKNCYLGAPRAHSVLSSLPPPEICPVLSHPLGVESSCSERKACLTTQRTPSRSSLLDSLVLCAEMMLDFLFTPCENLKLHCFLCFLPLLKSILSFLFVFSYCLHISRRKEKVKTNCHHIPSDTGNLQYTFYIQYDLC